MDNAHQVLAVMSPDKDYEDKIEKDEKTIFESKCWTLTDRDRADIFTKGQQLLEIQSKVDSDVDCLPTLQLSDIAQEDRIKLDHRDVRGIPLQIAVQPTNGVTYFHGIINTSNLPEKLKNHLPLFCMAATKMGAGTMDYRQLDQEMELKTGGLSIGIHLAEGLDSTRTYEEGVLLSSHCLDRNSADMVQL